jgi:hypothetical protein
MINVTLKDNLGRIREETHRRAAVLVEKVALDIELEIKTGMTEEKSGRVYTRAQGKTHQASAPGESPAIDSKELVKSVRTEEAGDLKRVVGSDDPVSVLLELGTDKIAPRPSFVPAAENHRQEFIEGARHLVD